MSERTWGDLVRIYFPEADDGLCEHILWELTCFPCGDVKEVETQLAHAKEVGIKAAHIEAEHAMEEK